jgi:hypothetical protein
MDFGGRSYKLRPSFLIAAIPIAEMIIPLAKLIPGEKTHFISLSFLKAYYLYKFGVVTLLI